MDRRRLEARVLDIVSRVVTGRRIEDDLIECKAAWSDPSKAARQLAAHANAARGADVIWVIGLDENASRVVTLGDTEPANWWAQVEKRFADDVAPELRFLRVPTEHGPVVCLHFETDRSPYLVTVAASGGVDREIPWRTGTRTRSAKRSEVLSLLVEASSPPLVELFGEELVATHVAASRHPVYSGERGEERIELHLRGKAFFEPTSQGGSPVMLPAHLWSIEMAIGSSELISAELEFHANMVRGGSGPTGWTREVPNADGATIRSSGLYVRGPDTVSVIAQAVLPPDWRQRLLTAPFVEIRLRMPAARSTRSPLITRTLAWVSGDEAAQESVDRRQVLGRWRPAER